MVETVYSAFKRYFGEFVSAKKWEYIKEIAAKVCQFAESSSLLKVVGWSREEKF